MTFAHAGRSETIKILKQLTDPIELYDSEDSARVGAIDCLEWVCDHVPAELCVARDPSRRNESALDSDGLPLYWVTPITLINTILSDSCEGTFVATQEGIELVIYETSYRPRG